MTKGITVWKTSNGMNITAFCGGYLSNFYPAKFSYKNKKWVNSEQAYQYEKAKFFGEKRIQKLIRKTSYPRLHKRLGQCVVGDDSGEDWLTHSAITMKHIVYAKFSQNATLKRKLLETNNNLLVEGQINDLRWGAGLSHSDKRIIDISKHNGKNLLGKILMQVRDEIKRETECQGSKKLEEITEL